MKDKGKNADIALMVIVVFFLGVVVGVVFLAPRTTFVQPVLTKLEGSSQITMNIPAVDNFGNGVLGRLVTEVKPGSGQVLVNVANLITLGDTQQSAQNAVRAATEYTHTDPNAVDVIYNMEVNATEIEGPSAGVNMAVAVVFALKNETPRTDVMMTGTIDSSGIIGSVGSVLEKAKAAKSGGTIIFIVPLGQSTEMSTVRSRQCRQIGSTQHCRIVYQSQQMNIGKTLNMTVVEAGSLGDAIKYFEKI